jgi:hypothetical protein
MSAASTGVAISANAMVLESRIVFIAYPLYCDKRWYVPRLL